MSGLAKFKKSRLIPVTVFIFMAQGVWAAPGGHLVDAISDECDTLNPMWTAGLRGMPESLTIQNGVLSIRSVDNFDDAYPSAEDMTSTYDNQIGRLLNAAEGPSIIAWIWLPPFAEWPTGVNASDFREWFGIRVTAYDAALPLNGGYYWPGIYVATDAAGPCLIARVGDGYGPDVTIGRVATAGWWTVGLSWNAQGVTEYYAAPGRVSLTDADLLHVTPKFSDPTANRSINQLVGNFVALRMTYPPTGQLSPDWRMDSFRVYVHSAPALPVLTPHVHNGQVDVQASGAARGFRCLLQRSEDLVSWETVSDFVSDGNSRTFSEASSGRAFYRIALP